MTTTYDLLFNPPADIAARRERNHERDLACHALLGGVQAIVEGAKFRAYLGDEYRLKQLADLLERTEARMAAADAKCEAALAEWSASLAAEALADPENDLRGV